MTDPIRLDRVSAVTFSVDRDSRTIKGLAVPYGAVGDNGFGRYRFAKGTLDWGKVKYLDQHNWGQAAGTVAFEDSAQGLLMTAKIAKGARGDQLLALHEPDPDTGEAVYDGLSIGLANGAVFDRAEDGVLDCKGATVIEVSGTPNAAFKEARVSSVAMSAGAHEKADPADITTERNTVTEQVTEAVEAAPAFNGADIVSAIKDGFAAIAPQRQVIPAATATVEVVEELPYNFSGRKAAHGLLADIVASKNGNGEAGERLAKFMADDVAPVFASITTGNVAGLNPSPTRPELYVDNLHYSHPLQNMVTTGGLDSVTAFVIPKFSSAAGLVGDHTPGTEPTGGSFVATTQTVTPSALSGKAVLNREVIDQGGSPQVDQIIWNEMQSGYFDNLEAAIAAALAAAATGEQNIGGGADDPAKVKLLKAYLSSLQFAKGGDRFSAFAADPTMYGLLTGATDSTGRPLLPILGATNSDGSLAPSMESVSVGGKRAVPAWALDKATANAELSYLFVPSSVYAWASAPSRFDFSYQVATVEVGIWGYKAAAVTRNSDVVAIDATTADV